MKLPGSAALALGTTSLVAMASACFADLAAAQAAVAEVGVGQAHPQEWPARKATVPLDPSVETRIDKLIAAMSLEQKVGQIIQADVGSVTPEDVHRYHLGSVLNGGNTTPDGHYNTPAEKWLAAADAFYAASMKPSGKLPRIPIIWGSDAVHGHNNIVGATLFPHNIGLGATRDPELIRRIGEATAIEMRVTGLDWTFAPTLAVVRDDRWGRTYEGFGETPEIGASYAAPLIEGLQGKLGDKDWLRGPHIVATAKHFLGDGGTSGGKDQGDTQMSEARLRDLFSPPYIPALNAGVQSIMVSFSSWNGTKMHGNRSMMTDLIKDRWNFDGFLVGDWNGHGQVKGCTTTDCPQAVDAGLDMYMAPDSWKDLYRTTLAHAKDGTLPLARLDDAVRRILRVKIRAGLFEAGKPSSRPYGGRFELLGSKEHRAVARQAVRESLVLLKNAGRVLPLKASANVLVAGDGADNMAKQAGGWTLSWQGTGTKRADFPNARTIWEGIDEAVRAAGGKATLSVDGSYSQKPDVAIVVFGEDPYAEFQGDRPDVAFDDAKNLALLRSLKAKGVPTVAVFLSGRAMWVNPFLNAADAFVAAWLPGSEGGGVADVLFGKSDFHGKLPYSWPKSSDQTAVNFGDKDYDPLFPYGFGLRFGDSGELPRLPEQRASAAVADPGILFAAGRPGNGRRLLLGAPGALSTNPGPSLIEARAVDRTAQEDSVRLNWTGAGKAIAAIVQDEPVDLSREANGELALELEFKVNSAPTADVSLLMTCGDNCLGGFPIGNMLAQAAVTQKWTRLAIPLRCFEKAGVDMSRVDKPLSITTAGRLDMTLSSARILAPSGPQLACK
ncbi:exo 1,3/1,4-beta-D-glucan glucohydrolase [Novosphingobium sp. KN65.2]|uniref:glycoside hydrolase family 3 protein n=1 Tax=Novosphingobium sp. KN65.2 TaxID=1478134 RepID=UPI0005DD9F01|nr:exo 1,3/1,4-beta-D-glucan glucohydrolase [Novosphingobium sp. KN65.2]CDO36053.1 Glucan 1,4-beta-glucosidase [Novosphingobium sp. KN65.2]